MTNTEARIVQLNGALNTAIRWLEGNPHIGTDGLGLHVMLMSVLNNEPPSILTVTREEAAKKVNEQFNREFVAAETNTCWHYGRVELWELLDFIYGGKPETEAENINRN